MGRIVFGGDSPFYFHIHTQLLWNNVTIFLTSAWSHTFDIAIILDEAKIWCWSFLPFLFLHQYFRLEFLYFLCHFGVHEFGLLQGLGNEFWFVGVPTFLFIETLLFFNWYIKGFFFQLKGLIKIHFDIVFFCFLLHILILIVEQLCWLREPILLIFLFLILWIGVWVYLQIFIMNTILNRVSIHLYATSVGRYCTLLFRAR